MKRPLFAALALSLAVSAHAQSQDAKPSGDLAAALEPFSLEGKWRGCAIGKTDQPCPPATDPRWHDVIVPGNYQSQHADWKKHNGFFWYRKSFTLPAALPAGAEPCLVMGGVDDWDTTWLNGVKIGHTGPDNFFTSSSAYNTPRCYLIPPGLLKAGENEITLLDDDPINDGGIGFGPVQLIFADPAKAARRHITWELGKNAIDPASIQGKVELVDGGVKLDGSNSFAIPASALGAQNDYTIEFEVKRDPNDDGLLLMSNASVADKVGLGLDYTSYGAGFILANDGRIEQGKLLPEVSCFYKLSFVVKDKQLQFFRDGLLLLATDAVNPSPLPLVFGQIKTKPSKPYGIRNLKICDSAIFPTGYDQSAERMRAFAGLNYFILRAEVKDLKLPRILVIGDSISMGYRGFITEHFKGKAYVDYWVGGTWFGSEALKDGDKAAAKIAWRGVFSNGPYDVISWNSMTLHMWSPKQAWRCPEESIVPNFSNMVEFLKAEAPKTQFIWVRCTPVRAIQADGTQKLDGPDNERMVKYNGIVDTVMKKEGIPEVDLYAIAEKQSLASFKGSQDNVHWGPEVSKLFADAIIKEIETQLAMKGK